MVLNKTEAHGEEKIENFRKCANTLQCPLAKVFYTALAQGQVPGIRRDSTITPIRKKSESLLHI